MSASAKSAPTATAPTSVQQAPLAPAGPAAPPIPAAPTAASPCLTRPALALSVHVMGLYKQVNARYCQEKRLRGPGPKYNQGYDDKDGHYIVLFGEEILERYTVQEVLGKGSFGTVLRCFDEKYQEPVAMKILSEPGMLSTSPAN